MRILLGAHRWRRWAWVALPFALFTGSALLFLAPGAADDSGGRLWQTRTGDIVYAVATSADGALIVLGSRDSTAYALDRSAARLWTYPTTNAVNAVAVSPDGAYVAVGSADGTLTLLSRAGRALWKRPTGAAVSAVALSAGATRVVYGAGSTALSNGNLTLHLLDHVGRPVGTATLSGSPRAVAITPDGRRIAVGADDDSVTLFDGTGKQIWQQGGGDIVDGVAISRDGARVAAGSEDHHVYLYNGVGNDLWTFAAGGPVRAVAMSGDGVGVRVAAAVADGTVDLLDGTGRPVWRDATGHAAYAVALSADGRVLVLGLDTGAAQAVDIGAALAGAASGQRALDRRLAAGGAAALAVLVAYALYVRANPRRRAVAALRVARLRHGGALLWHARASYALLSPIFLLLLLFNYYPSVSGLYHALTEWNGVTSSFVGLTNFQAMVRDPYLTVGIVNLLIILVAGVVKTIVFPLLVAELIFHLRARRAQYWVRTAFVIPTIVPVIATILVWRFIYDPNLGLANQVLRGVGLSGWTHSWLGEPGWALGSVIFIGFPWIAALPFLVLYAGLIGIPGELLEAATVDGAGVPRRIWSLHLPLLLGQVKLLLILIVIAGVQDFSAIYILTQGGPTNSTYVPALDLFQNATSGNLGYASAIGVALFVVIMGVTILQLRLVRSAATDYSA